MNSSKEQRKKLDADLDRFAGRRRVRGTPDNPKFHIRVGPPPLPPGYFQAKWEKERKEKAARREKREKKLKEKAAAQAKHQDKEKAVPKTPTVELCPRNGCTRACKERMKGFKGDPATVCRRRMMEYFFPSDKANYDAEEPVEEVEADLDDSVASYDTLYPDSNEEIYDDE